MGKNLNVSIVLYNSKFSDIETLVKLLKTYPDLNQVFLIDNSPNKSSCFEKLDTQYIFTGKNIGYGSGHNIAIRKSIEQEIPYHLVMNTDIVFSISVLDVLIKKLISDSKIGLIMPKIINSDKSPQILPKLLPSPSDVLIHAIKPLSAIFRKTEKKYTLCESINHELNVPLISGCFSMFNNAALQNVGLYDEGFFMYFEDFDLSRRVHRNYKTLYYPAVVVEHAHERGAAKSAKLFRAFILSAIKYFNKYGWLFDSERKKTNQAVEYSLNIKSNNDFLEDEATAVHTIIPE